MKRIIAAALSVLVGAFGYTIVDKALEDRVATLESEVVELREEVSRYHPQYSLFDTTTNIFTTIKNNYSTITTTERPSTTIDSSYWQPTAIGCFLDENSTSMRKYLIREYINGHFQYIAPNAYTSVPFYTRPPENNKITYANNMAVAENYIYVTESSAQLTNMLEDVSYSYFYNNDYSLVSTSFTKVRYPINVKCEGYTDPSLAGKRIVFSVAWIGNSRPDTIISNTIKPDGSFAYEAIYSSSYRMYNYDASYGLSSISVS